MQLQSLLPKNFSFESIDFVKLKVSSLWEEVDRLPKWVWVGCSVLGAAICYKIHYDRVYGVWKRQGIDGPTPWPLIGTLGIFFKADDLQTMDKELFEKYGQKGYVGCYQSSTPLLVVSDPNIVCEVMIKKFDVFTNRINVDHFQPKYFRKIISILRNEEWRNVRTSLTPLFTGMKLKQMLPMISEIGHHMSSRFEHILKTDSQEFELKNFFRSCTLDIICNIVFGINVDSQNTENRIAKACMNMTIKNEDFASSPFFFVISVPAISRIYKHFDPRLGLNFDAVTVTEQVMNEIIWKQKKGENHENYTFFLQSLVENFSLHEETNGKEGYDYETAVAQALIFLLAGFETTANLMMWTSYYLALYPELQQEVYEEIVSVVGKEGKDTSYENVNKLELLDNVLHEVLRLRPIFRTQREAKTDTVIGPGIKIKKGSLVEVAVNVLHNDPKIWNDPEVFRPSRFEAEESKQRSPYAFNAFGVGPRNCIGMRLALFEVKLSIVKLLAGYEVKMGKNTPIEIKRFKKAQFADTKDPLFLKVARRT